MSKTTICPRCEGIAEDIKAARSVPAPKEEQAAFLGLVIPRHNPAPATVLDQSVCPECKRKEDGGRELEMVVATDAVAILHDRFVGDDPEKQARLAVEKEIADAQQKTYDEFVPPLEKRIAESEKTLAGIEEENETHAALYDLKAKLAEAEKLIANGGPKKWQDACFKCEAKQDKLEADCVVLQKELRCERGIVKDERLWSSVVADQRDSSHAENVAMRALLLDWVAKCDSCLPTLRRCAGELGLSTEGLTCHEARTFLAANPAGDKMVLAEASCAVMRESMKAAVDASCEGCCVDNDCKMCHQNRFVLPLRRLLEANPAGAKALDVLKAAEESVAGHPPECLCDLCHAVKVRRGE